MNTLPEEIIVAIAEYEDSDGKNDHALVMKSVAKLYNKAISNKLTKFVSKGLHRGCVSYGTQVNQKWVKANPSLTNTNVTILISDVREIADRRFKRVNIRTKDSVWDPAAPEKYISQDIIKDMVSEADKFTWHSKRGHPTTFKNGTLSWSQSSQNLGFFASVYGMKINKLVLMNDGDLASMKPHLSLLKNVNTIKTWDMTVDALTDLCYSVPANKVVCWTERYIIPVLPHGLRQIKTFVTDREGKWEQIMPLLNNIHTLEIRTHTGKIYRPTTPISIKHIIAKYYIHDTKPIMDFIDEAYENIMEITNVKVTYMFGKISVSNTEPVDVVMEKLVKMGKLLAEKICEDNWEQYDYEPVKFE